MYRLSEFKYIIEIDADYDFPITEVFDWCENKMGETHFLGPGTTMLTGPWYYAGPWCFQFMHESDYVEFCLRWN